MNMRQHKRWVMARQLAPWTLVFAGQRGLDREEPVTLGTLLARKIALQALVEEQPVFEPSPQFNCVKVNGGEVVATFDTQEEALALLLKHSKQRKAKLQVLDVNTGELVLFPEEATA